MNITLYSTNSDKKVCNKVLTGATVKSCTIKDATNINMPILYLQNDVNLMNYNYAYIDGWGYYYIINKGVDNGQRNVIYLEYDPRKSMLTDIRASGGIITRQANGEAYIPDARSQKSAEVKTRILNFPTQVCTSDNRYLLTIGGVKTS